MLPPRGRLAGPGAPVYAYLLAIDQPRDDLRRRTMTHPILDPETIHAFVIAGHGNLAKVQAMLAETPALRAAGHEAVVAALEGRA